MSYDDIDAEIQDYDGTPLESLMPPWLPEDMMHYGILRKSGRYPWGSGKDEYTRSMDFYAVTNHMKNQGLDEKTIAQAVGLSLNDLRATRTIAKEQIVLEETMRCTALKEKGYKSSAIAQKLGMPEPTVRLRIKNSENIKESSLRKTAEVIRKNVDEHQIVDIGKGNEVRMGISPERMRAAVSVLRDEGYETYTLQTRMVGSKNNINQKVIVPPGTGYGNAKKLTDKIHTMGEWSENEGLTYFGIHKPLNVSSDRLKVVFDEDGGTAMDGTVLVRRGAPDLDMGKNNYAQVRIAIDGTHFIKGMAILSDDLPKGTDLVFHTNKSKSVGKIGALKELKNDPDNPFGSQIKRQIVDIDPKTGKDRVKSAINLVNEAGDWDQWGLSLPSQVLAKQPHSLIKSQLDDTRKQAKARLDEINSITNAVVRKKALDDFAERVDADAVDLRAAAMPRQRTQVILPMPFLKKDQIYAPNFETGEPVILIRFPHGGRFEIPEVVVNNNSRKAKALLGNAIDAIGIHPSVAEKLSGADFDGDTVVVIPNRAGKIKGSNSLGSAAKVYEKELNSFDPKRKYGGYEEKDGKGNFKIMKNTGLEMGMITNLITDMQIQGASPDHVVRAVKHSMVVIDAEKHKLNYKQSEIDNGIAQLRSLYQTTHFEDGTSKTGGATTLLSKATAKERVPERKLRPAKEGGPINPATGEKVYVPTGKQTSVYDPKTQTYKDEKRLVTENVKRLALTNDAFTLVRDKKDPVEKLYAEHANEMKALANNARLQSVRTANPKTNPRAKEVYRAEVDDLVRQLRVAEAQKPLDRRAQIVAASVVKAKRQDDPTLRTDPDRLKKVERQSLGYARSRLNLKKPVIEISDRQWDAIQAGAVSASRLSAILEYADPKRVMELAMPRTNVVVTSAVGARAKAMINAGATTADVAASLGISASTLRAAIQRGDLSG